MASHKSFVILILFESLNQMVRFEVASLLEKLWRLRTHHAHLISGIDKELELVVKDLSVWKKFLLEHDEEFILELDEKEDEAIRKEFILEHAEKEDEAIRKEFLLEHDEEEDKARGVREARTVREAWAVREVKREIKKCVYEVDDSIDAYLTQMAASKVKNFLTGFLFSRRINSCSQRRKMILQLMMIGTAKRHSSTISSYPERLITTFPPVQMDNVVGRDDDENTIIQMDNVVGRDDDENTIINFLMKPEPGVISIVGVGGLGKSTLARKIYVNTRIVYEFPVRIWINASYNFNLDDILRNILRVFTSQDMHSLSHEELSENVQACLKKKKFLLVLDNIWNLPKWEAIKVVLLNSNNMGKVLITTRATYIGEPPNFNIDLRFLDAEESWKLLQLKLFGNLEHCPFELEAAGRSLAHTCNGLPLNIVLVGGLLKWQLMKSSTPDPIKDVLKLYEKVNMEPLNVVRLAYRRLSDELRQCFLYMGVFPEGYEISAWTLTRLWIAEGFVQPMQFHSLEEAATRNLDGLIRMGLVMVDKINPLGKVKTCRIHEIISDFIMRKCKEQELFQWLSLVDKGRCICRRICVDSYDNINLLSKVPKSPGVRSVLCFSEPPPTGMDPSYTSTILNTFHLLKVLDSKSIKIHKLPPQITKLLHLRYVTLSVDIINTIPEPLSGLWNLETLVVDTKSRVITMEANIWRLIWLRHLKTNATIILPSYNEDLSSNIGEDQSLAGENDLQTLTRLSPESCTTDVSERARNLKSLGIRGDLEILFGKMFLERFDLLEKLKLIHDVFPKMSSENPLHQLPPPNHFPPNLKWLTLSLTHLLWDRDMPTLANIKTLEVLKLKDDAFTGVIWRGSTEDCFPSLKFFLIENTNLVLWKASTKSLPRLSCLVLKNCENLKEIPEAIAENLERLEIERLGKSAVDSARRIADQKQQAQEKKKTDFPFKLYIGHGCY